VGAEDLPPPIPVVESRIDRVLLYSDRALVIRAGKIQVGAGRTKVAFEGLPGELADYSVAAALTGAGGGQIANIEIEPVYKTSFRSKEAEDAARELKDLEREMRALVTHRFPLARIAEAVTAHLEAPDATLGTLLLMEH